MVRTVERIADDPDASVHHVGGRHDVGSGIGEDERAFGQHVQGRVVDDGLTLHQPVMAMIGERVERDIHDDTDLRHVGFQAPDRLRHEPVGVERLTGVGVLQ